MEKAKETGSPIVFADEMRFFVSADRFDDHIFYRGTYAGDISGELTGDCQVENAATILCAVKTLRDNGMSISDGAISNGFAHVTEFTGLAGRWMRIADNPLTICDTGHNEGGWQYLAPRLDSYGNRLVMVIGFVNDKDVSHILAMMPHDARYIFTQAAIPRAMDAGRLTQLAETAGLHGETIASVPRAIATARRMAGRDGIVFVGEAPTWWPKRCSRQMLR